MEKPIDIVITWVDGADAHHREKMKPFLEEEFGVQSTKELADDRAGETRFRSVGEINYCVASIYKFAPFVRKIFLVTDNQNPHLDGFVKKHFPSSEIQIEIVDHTVLFKEYEAYLPLFNSLSIETFLYRIPGLSENFVYLNDDFFLVRPVEPSDWFINDKAVAYGKWALTDGVKFLSYLKPIIYKKNIFGFKDSMINAVRFLPWKKRFFMISHTPQPLKKSVFEQFYKQNETALLHNLLHRFRHPSQFNPQVLFYMLALHSGEAVACKKNKLLYLKPVNRGDEYVERKKNEFINNSHFKFLCIGSLDKATESDKSKVFDWLQKLMLD